MAAVLHESQELLGFLQDQDLEDGVASADLQSVSDPADGMSCMDSFQKKKKRVHAETLQASFTGREASGRRNLALMRLEEYTVVGTAKHSTLWKRSVCFIKCFHDLSDSELVLLIAVQVKGTAKNFLDILEINDMQGISWIRDGVAES